MKKIINGKKYDIQTAEHIANYWNGLSEGDFNSLSENLYRKKTGEFFLHGEGHGLTKYASHSGNMSGWGEMIIPLSVADAQIWAMKHMKVEDYEAVFGEVPE